MRLQIETIGKDRLDELRCAWTEFELAVALPFAYEGRPEYGTFVEDVNRSPYAEVRVRDGIATLRVMPDMLKPEAGPQRRLTLMHEAIHIASFTGWLRDLRVQVDKLQEAYWYADPVAHWLANYIFEIDAELWFPRLYPDDSRARARYLTQIICDGHKPHDDTPEKARPYCSLRDQLSAELAGMLMQQPDVEATLARRLDVPARLPEPVAALHQLLSPKTRDYWALAKWGAAAYEQTLQVYVDDVQRTHPTDGRGGS